MCKVNDPSSTSFDGCLHNLTLNINGFLQRNIFTNNKKKNSVTGCIKTAGNGNGNCINTNRKTN